MIDTNKLEQLNEIDDSDFKVWLSHPITKLLLKDVKEKIIGAENYILNNVNYGTDSVHYSFYMKGGIVSYKDIINYNFSAFDELRKLYLEEVKDEIKTNRYNGSG